MAQPKPPDRISLDLDNVDAPNIDFYTSIQNNNNTLGEDFSIVLQALWGHRVANYLLSGTGDHQFDDTWRPKRMLGKGAFGLVGLWEKVNVVTGEVEDQVAIKEMQRSRHHEHYLQRNSSLAREAAIMQQLNNAEQRGRPRNNNSNDNNILRLRSYKNFPMARRSRFYLEFAPYGDLVKLMYLYKAWDTYLPEEFLWHCFYSFAKVAVLMEKGPFTDLEDQRPTKSLVVHFDIKPDNVYMGKPSDTAILANYPTIKVADFGLSNLTGEDDPDNPSVYRRLGTEDFRPPEQINLTTHWVRRPDGRRNNLRLSREAWEEMENRFQDPGYQYLSKHNVWAFGKLMYDMLTLSWPFELDAKMKEETTEFEYYQSLNEHAIPEITTGKNPEYSSSLRELIRECLHIEIRKRPTPGDLLSRTYRGYCEVVRSRRTETNDFGGTRVYYMGHEINHMPLGNAGLSMRRGDFREIKRVDWPDPEWQPLLSARWAPQVRNGELVDDSIEEGGPKQPFPTLNTATVKQDPKRPGGVIWKLGSPSKASDEQGGDGKKKGDDDDGDQEYQNYLNEKIRNSGTRNTRIMTPIADQGDAARRRNTVSLARERANNYLEELAASMVYPPRRQPPPQQPPPQQPPPQRPPPQQPPPQQPPPQQPPPQQPPPSQPHPQQPPPQQPPPQQPQQPPSPQQQPPAQQPPAQRPSSPSPPPQPPVRIRLNPPRPPPQPPRRPARRKKRVLGLSIDETIEEPEGEIVQGHNLRKRPRRSK